MADQAGWGQLPQRGRVELRGYVESVTYPAASAAPVFGAMLAPDVAPPGGRKQRVQRVRLRWIGQRKVPGVDAGTWLRCTGLLTLDGESPVMYDPRYEILEMEEDHA
ncbi:hypothetical protein [Galactobacter caseinivorans]|uniref:hypothetical protein n=1 Tax=Galactobacter caseinivorans TaxID=2676123 RepID=UPI001F268175|nr:hypothetical protein [Galactobacter caseinivorans]